MDAIPFGEPVQRAVPVYGVSWAADGKTIVAVEAASSSGSLARDQSHLIVVDASTRSIKSYDAHTGDAKVIALSTDGRYAISGGEDFLLRRRDLTREAVAPIRMAGHKSSIVSVAASPDSESRIIASGGEDETVRLWSSRTGDPIGVPLPGVEATVTALAFSPDAKWLAAGAGSLLLWELDPQWAESPGNRIGTRALLTTRSVRGLANQQQATVTAGILYLGNKALRPKRSSDAEPRAACAAATPEQRVSSQSKTVDPAAAAMRATGLARSADGLQVYSGHADGKLRRWSVSSAEEMDDPLVLSTCALGALATSADGQRLVAASANQIFLIDLARWRVDKQLPRAPGATALALSDDGRWLVWGGRTSDATTGKGRPGESPVDEAPWAVMSRDLLLDPMLGALSERRLMSSPNTIVALAFGHDLRFVAAITGGAMRFWDRDAGYALPPLDLARTRVSGLWFDNDGKRVFTEATDGTVRPWPVPDQWPGLMCEKIGANLSRKAWRETISAEVPYLCQCPGLSIERDDPKSTTRREMCPAEGAASAATIARRGPF